MRTERVRERVWAVMVGLVLADSSIVTLALPDVLRAFDTTVFGVSWVLTAFNLVLAVAIVPASRLARRLAPPVWAARARGVRERIVRLRRGALDRCSHRRALSCRRSAARR